MSSSGHSQVAAELRPLAERHEALRGHRRWRLRGWGWGFLAFLWLINLVEPDGELAWGSLVLTVIVGGVVEAALRIGYRFDAGAAAAELNRAFPMGTERDDAVALLRERCRLGKEPGRAARRLLAALYLPLEGPREDADPPSAPIPLLDLSPAPAAGGGTSGEARRKPVRRPPPNRGPIPIEVAPYTGNPPAPHESAPTPMPLQPEAIRGDEDE